MRRKIERINNGLHCVEKMLQQKSRNIEEAHEIQKVMHALKWLWAHGILSHPCPRHPSQELLSQPKVSFLDRSEAPRTGTGAKGVVQVGRELIWNTQSPGCELQHSKKQGMWHMPVVRDSEWERVARSSLDT